MSSHILSEIEKTADRAGLLLDGRLLGVRPVGEDARPRNLVPVGDIKYAARGPANKKELHATFTSPIAYSIAGMFLLVLGYTFSLTLFATKIANLDYIFHQIYVLSILLVPALTMRAFAEARRRKRWNCCSPHRCVRCRSCRQICGALMFGMACCVSGLTL